MNDVQVHNPQAFFMKTAFIVVFSHFYPCYAQEVSLTSDVSVDVLGEMPMMPAITPWPKRSAMV